MIVTCEKCRATYNDTYRLTFCPHEQFEMNTTVGNASGIIGVAHSVEELKSMLGQEKNK